MHWLFALFFIVVLTGCREERSWRIGVSQCSDDDWRSKLNDEINREIMFHDDAVVEIRSANDNSKTQIEDIRYFADNGFDIIIVSPNEAAALTPIIKEVYESGIPVIIFDRNIIGDSYTARIGVDDVGIGKAAAHYALQFTGHDGRAIEIYGLPGSTPAEDRHTGFASEFEKNGGKIVASVPANWNMEDAAPVADSLLKNYQDINVIFAHNDRMAIGASSVIDSLSRPNIKIIGIDATPETGIRAIADGKIDATFLYPTDGHRLIRTALAILNEDPYERETLIPASSAVDRSNADILLRQDETLKDETDKLMVLKKQMDDYWVQHSSQTSLFYACIAIIILLIGFVFMILRAYWQHKRHQAVLEDQYRVIEKERDIQKDLNKQLEEATQSKLMFFTNVSHDLRTPLTLIAGPIAQLTSSDNLTPSQKTLIKIADKNVRILTRLINQILDFRKYENNKMELVLSEIDLGKAIADWMESFHTLAQKRDLKLTLDTPPGDDPKILAAVDPEKFERVFFNLLSNAFKYTPANGRINVSYAVEGETFVLKVSDTGRGISERDLGNIFDRFYQVDRVHPNGSGIGLSLTKAFVELHGGTITVDSVLNKGSVFTVTLPIRHISEDVVEPQKIISEAEIIAELDNVETTVTFEEDRPVILIIDDNKDILQLVSELLKDNYNILTAANGQEGIRKSTKYVPDLIICDVMMPVMDGLECCRRLKSEITTSHIPVLMLTACSMDEQRIQGYDSGADGYLSKPFNDSVLKSRCASLIANRKRIKEIWSAKETIAIAEPGKTKTLEKAATGDIDNEFYNRFLEIFRTEMGNPEMNVDGIAARMGLERSQFYRKIKALTNYSPVELIRHLRLKQGRQLLVSTEKTISEIAYEIGFSTPAYFTKCFRDAFGETPTEVRKNIGK